MKKKINTHQFLIIALLTVSSLWTWNITIWKVQAQNILEVRLEKQQEINIIGSQNRKKWLKEVESDNWENIQEKSILKKEIQNRKKLHKTLLESYNTNFDTKILENITQNGIILNNLKKIYVWLQKNKEIII